MINVNDFKNGVTIKLDNNLFAVLEFQHVKPGKGPAFVRTKLKNLRTGATIDHTFNAGVKVEPARVEKKDMQFLYKMNNIFYFMNMDDYEQIELAKDLIGDDSGYLTENLNISITFYEGEVLGLTLPDKIEMVVTSTESVVKGNTTSSAMKDATLETGLIIKVPLFVEQGEKILISTKDG
ncbi:MAG: elongation factor P, partial [Bacilli bacterium]